MRRREYLKHKNGDLEELPKKLSMRNSAKYGNCNWKPWVYRYREPKNTYQDVLGSAAQQLIIFNPKGNSKKG